MSSQKTEDKLIKSWFIDTFKHSSSIHRKQVYTCMRERERERERETQRERERERKRNERQKLRKRQRERESERSSKIYVLRDKNHLYQTGFWKCDVEGEDVEVLLSELVSAVTAALLLPCLRSPWVTLWIKEIYKLLECITTSINIIKLTVSSICFLTCYEPVILYSMN